VSVTHSTGNREVLGSKLGWSQDTGYSDSCFRVSSRSPQVNEEPRQLSRYSNGLQAERPGIHSRQGQEIFLLYTASRLALGPAQPPIQWVPWVFPGVKRPGRAADHSPPSSAKVKNTGAIPPLPHTPSWYGA
jgi:hypothetical protein